MNTTEGKLINSHQNSSQVFEDLKVNVKVKLSALWVALMLFYIYADILGFYSPGVIDEVVAGEVGGVQITEGFLFVMAVWMAIPSIMVIFSLVLKANLNRWVNIIAGILSVIALAATFFVGEYSARYVFQAVVEAVLIASIVWQAWRWPVKQG